MCVTVGIARDCCHRVRLLMVCVIADVVIVGIVHGRRHRVILLTMCAIVDIVHGRWHHA